MIEESENNIEDYSSVDAAGVAEESYDVVARLQALHVECIDEDPTTQTRRERSDCSDDAGVGGARRVTDTESEVEGEADDDLAEQVIGDGPGDSVVTGLKVYSNA